MGCGSRESSLAAVIPTPVGSCFPVTIANMLYDPTRHESLLAPAWDEEAARALIESIVRDSDAAFTAEKYWPWHPKDSEPGDDPTQPATPLYHGAAGVIWALHYLQDVGATSSNRRYDAYLPALLDRNRDWLKAMPADETASYLAGDVPILMMLHGADTKSEYVDPLASLIERNLDHPARELMWGAPGTMLAALLLHERDASERWAELFRHAAERLWSQLEWSPTRACHYWTQNLYGRRSTYLDAVHGFVGTAFVLIRGRHLLAPDAWAELQQGIETTISRTAIREDGMANWRTELEEAKARPLLMQYCHGAPGFVICLADLPSTALDSLLLEAGEAVWKAGPLTKGSNLCHGTGGNGYAFLKLFKRTGNRIWLERARAFAMHGIAQTHAGFRKNGQWRYSLWTGDLGFAVYLWDCIRGEPAFPTLDDFFGRSRNAKVSAP